MVVVELSGVLVHDLMGDLQGIMMLKFRFDVIVWVLIRMLINEQVLDCTFTNGPLVNSKTCGEFPVLPNANLFQQIW